jgi:iron complex outermembrane receptor protein
MESLMKHNRNPLAKAINYALGAGMIASLAMTAAPVYAQDDDEEEAADLDRVQVTGSRIKRTDMEGALPVTVIDRETIDASGESNAADLIRNLPFNSSGSYRPQSGSSFGGAALVSLRGLGASRTLVLVNGRRMPKAPLTGASNDLSMIPMGAIERIEILRDGASAIYGSDAIGGVINVILRNDFEGAEIMVGRASPNIPSDGGDRDEGYVTFGTSSDTTSIIGGASWNSRDIVFARDFPWAVDGASVYSNNFSTITDGFDNFNYTTLPNGACEGAGDAFFTLASPGSLTGERCGFNFTSVSADEASVDNESAYLRADHRFTDNWSVYSDIMIAKTKSFGRYAPVPDGSYFSAPITPSSPNNPTNPDSPLYDPSLGLDPQPVNVWHRFASLGNRDNNIDSELYDLVAGFTGYIGMAELDFGARWTRNKVFDIGRNYLVRSTAFGYIEDGTYDLSDPSGNPDNVLNAMKATISRISFFDQKQFYANVGFDLFETGAGPISWNFGADYFEEDYSDQYDSLSEAGQIGGSAGSSAAGSRDVTALYFETLIPILDGFEATVAGRYDDYSDFGDNFSPQIGLRYEIADGYVIRGSYGEGFRAPTLPVLTQQTSFSATSVDDPQSCIATGQPENCNLQINEFIQANPDLGPEESEQFSIGFAFAPFDWLNGTIDYYDIKITNRIRSFAAQDLINFEQAGDPIPPGLSITRAPNGAIVRIDSGFGNEGFVDTSGFDINLTSGYDALGGRFSHNLNLSIVDELSTDGGRNQVEDPGLPEMRGTLQNQYAWGDFSFVYNLNYIGDQCDVIDDGACVGSVPSWITHDVQANYFTPWNGKITVGAQNVGDKAPPIGVGFTDGRDYDFNLYNGFGRITYVRYTQSF